MSTIQKNTFFRHNLIFFVGSLAIGFINYLYYPLLGRLLKVEQFGEVQALFSILTQTGILFTAFGLVVIHITVNKSKAEAQKLLEEIEKLGLYVLLVLGVLWLAGLPFLTSFLKFSDKPAVAIFYVALMLGFFVSTRLSVIQGREDYAGLTISGVIGAFAKVAFSIVFVMLGWGVLGAVMGLFVGQVGTLIYQIILAKKHGFRVRLNLGSKIDWQKLKPEIEYVIPVFVTSLAITLLFTSDILIVKHFFSPAVAGTYAGVAAIGRIIIFLTASFSGVLFTKVKKDATSKQNFAVLMKSLALLIFIGGAATLVMILVPDTVVRLMIGHKYLSQSSNLPWLAAALFMLSIVNLIAYYDLALRNKLSAILITGGALFGFMLVLVNHNTIRAVIQDLLYATMVILLARIAAGVVRSRYIYNVQEIPNSLSSNTGS